MNKGTKVYGLRNKITKKVLYEYRENSSHKAMFSSLSNIQKKVDGTELGEKFEIFVIGERCDEYEY